MNAKFLQGETITLEQVLDAREHRLAIQTHLLHQFPYTLISFTLNIVGSMKVFPLSIQSFNEGVRLIKEQFKQHNVQIIHYKEIKELTGYEAFFIVDAKAEQVKKWLTIIEELNDFGRLFDIDVIRTDGSKISRTELGFPSRQCLMCEEEAFVCSRSRRHTVEELLTEEISIMVSYFNNQFSETISTLMSKSLLYEVSTTPKPGLVDRNNAGAHQDMDIFTFIDSTAVLTPYFKRFVEAGMKNYKKSLPQLFELIRPIGMYAESNMLDATKHVNTHKGLIFSAGIICAALGYMYANKLNYCVDNIFCICQSMLINLKNDFMHITEQTAKSHGEKLFVKYGIMGIRGEAMQGFPSLSKVGIPTLKKYLHLGASLNDAGAITLLHLMAYVQDTNIITRSSFETMLAIQEQTKIFVESNPKKIDELLDFLKGLDNDFIKQNISPGGSADLLALTYFFYFMEQHFNL